MNQLTTDVFGNYVIQKFFEHLGFHEDGLIIDTWTAWTGTR